MAAALHLGFCLALGHRSASQSVGSRWSTDGARCAIGFLGSPRWHLRCVVPSSARGATIGRQRQSQGLLESRPEGSTRLGPLHDVRTLRLRICELHDLDGSVFQRHSPCDDFSRRFESILRYVDGFLLRCPRNSVLGCQNYGFKPALCEWALGSPKCALL